MSVFMFQVCLVIKNLVKTGEHVKMYRKATRVNVSIITQEKTVQVNNYSLSFSFKLMYTIHIV